MKLYTQNSSAFFRYIDPLLYKQSSFPVSGEIGCVIVKLENRPADDYKCKIIIGKRCITEKDLIAAIGTSMKNSTNIFSGEIDLHESIPFFEGETFLFEQSELNIYSITIWCSVIINRKLHYTQTSEVHPTYKNPSTCNIF